MVTRWPLKPVDILYVCFCIDIKIHNLLNTLFKNDKYVFYLFRLFFIRVNINSKESLFGVNRLQDIGNYQLQKYCDCATEIHSSENSIANHFTANCSIATPAILCSQQTTSQRYTSECKRYQDRFKRDVNLEDDDSDDVMEVFPLKLDPSFDPNFIPPVIDYWTSFDLIS